MTSMEKISKWMGDHRPSQLDAPTAKLRDDMFRALRREDHAAAERLSTVLRQHVGNMVDSNTRAEIWADCGVVAFQRDDHTGAISLFKRAVAESPAKSHMHAFCSWLLGEAQWAVDDQRQQAWMTWDRVIQELEYLEVRSDRENDLLMRDWYRMKIRVIKRVLQGRISRFTRH